MIYKDECNVIYKVVKKNGQLYLIHENKDRNIKDKINVHVIVKGIDNINKYIINNKLKKIHKGSVSNGN